MCYDRNYHQTVKYWSRKTAKNPTYNAFYASKLQDYVEEVLLFQNISKSKNYPCWPRSPISSHNTKLGHATFCWFCDAGSHILLLIKIGSLKKLFANNENDSM